MLGIIFGAAGMLLVYYTVQAVFALQDTSAPVEIEISELISFDNTILESGIYNFS